MFFVWSLWNVHSETWVEWNTCTQMATSHKRTCRKQIKRGRVAVLNLLKLSAVIWNANIMYILANKKRVEAPPFCIKLNKYLRMDSHTHYNNFPL